MTGGLILSACMHSPPSLAHPHSWGCYVYACPPILLCSTCYADPYLLAYGTGVTVIGEVNSATANLMNILWWGDHLAMLPGCRGQLVPCCQPT